MSTRAYATVTGPTAVFTTTDGHTEPVVTTPGEDIRLAVVRRATEEAQRAGNPVELVTSGDRGDHHLLVHSDGTLTPLTTPTPDLTRTDGDEPIDEVPFEMSDAALEAEAIELFGEEVTASRSQPDALTISEEAPAAGTAAPARPTFLTANRDAAPHGLLHRLGWTKESSPAYLARERALAAVARQWAGCRTIAVVNGKGGVGKTMTTGMLAAVFARHGGGNVLAWDNNDTRGTLGWRTQPGLYDTTIRDLHHNAARLLDPSTGVSDISRYVHHQPDDRYDVLRSNPELLATDQRLTTTDFDLLMSVAARYYRIVVFDSGNDESADRWLRMIDSAYQLVIPTLTTAESAESAALLLDALRTRNAHSAALADSAVVVVTQQERTPVKELNRIVDGFAGHVRAVETIPYDPALKSGPLRYAALRPRTRDAWIHAAAATAAGL